MAEHLTKEGKFKSDKYNWCPEGYIAFKFTDPLVHDSLLFYAAKAPDEGLARDIVAAVDNVGKEAAEKETAQVGMDGSPAVIVEPNILIRFQCGPIMTVGVNGTQIEDVLDVLIKRLYGFQSGAFKCRENALAITKLEEAKHWLAHRTAGRQARGVEGKNET